MKKDSLKASLENHPKLIKSEKRKNENSTIVKNKKNCDLEFYPNLERTIREFEIK